MMDTPDLYTKMAARPENLRAPRTSRSRLDHTKSQRAPCDGQGVAKVAAPPRRPDRRLTPEQAELAARHVGLVAIVARQIVGQVGDRVMSFDELRSVGNEALVHAAARYRPDHRARFASFATWRVRGAMIDALRRRTPHRRRRVRAENRLRRLAEAAGEATDAADKYVQRSRERVRRALFVEHVLGAYPCSSFEAVPSGWPSPEQALIAAEQRHLLRSLLLELGPEEQILVEALYVHGRSMTDIAQDTGVSCATISRRHSRIIEELRERISAAEEDWSSCWKRSAARPVGRAPRRGASRSRWRPAAHRLR